MADTIVARERAIFDSPDMGPAAPASRGSLGIASHRAAQSGGATEQVAQGLEEMAHLAASADRSCYHHHDTFMVGEDEHLSPEQVNLELDRLRDVIRRLGWMADVCYTRLTGAAGVRSAEGWFFSPLFNKMSEEIQNGRTS